MALVTIFRQPGFQLLDLRFELLYLLFQGQQFCHQPFERCIFFSKSLQFFFLRHGPTVVRFNGFGKSLSTIKELLRHGICSSRVRNTAKVSGLYLGALNSYE